MRPDAATYWSTKEIARALGVTEMRAWRWVDRGLVRPHHAGDGTGTVLEWDTVHAIQGAVILHLQGDITRGADQLPRRRFEQAVRVTRWMFEHGTGPFWICTTANKLWMRRTPEEVAELASTRTLRVLPVMPLAMRTIERLEWVRSKRGRKLSSTTTTGGTR